MNRTSKKNNQTMFSTSRAPTIIIIKEAWMNLSKKLDKMVKETEANLNNQISNLKNKIDKQVKDLESNLDKQLKSIEDNLNQI